MNGRVGIVLGRPSSVKAPSAGSWWVDVPRTGFSELAESHVPRMRLYKFSALESFSEANVRKAKRRASEVEEE